jgi:hypothetical protein
MGPTSQPTNAPRIVPKSQPANAPRKEPTLPPQSFSSPSITLESLSEQPTEQPTHVPTQAPSNDFPSKNPTLQPAKAHSTKPTAQPTISRPGEVPVSESFVDMKLDVAVTLVGVNKSDLNSTVHSNSKLA